MERALTPRLSTGVAGIDEILGGGFIAGRSYLVRGGPGTGKTMLGLHFLAAGAARGERTLFISLEEPEQQLREDALAIGMDLQGVEFLDLSPQPEFFTEGKLYDIFTPAEVEREPTTRKIIERVEALRPERVFLDAVTQFRYLCSDDFQFHQQVLSFIRFLRDKGVTLVMTSEGSAIAPDDDLQFLCDGVLHLDFAAEVRSLRVAKFRSADFRGGTHSLRLTDRGMQVYPRLLAERHGREFTPESISSGVPELDRLLQGGLERGTVTVITGPSGVGKTTLGLSFMKEAAQRGERSVVYSFEEDIGTMLRRSEQIAIPVGAMIAGGSLSLVQVEPLRYTPDEFCSLVRQEVEERHASIVMLDSVSGYRLCMQGEDLVRQIHALGSYLRNMGVTGILVNETESITGAFRVTEIGVSYVTDNIVFLHYIEIDGELRRAIGVLKKRMSGFESAMREFRITPRGLTVGEPLKGLRGLLTGEPEWAGPARGGRRRG